VQRWKHYLQGIPFIIKTDHISLKYLLEQRLNHTVQHKVLCKLLWLDYVIQYKRGVENRVVDALSRRGHDLQGKSVLVLPHPTSNSLVITKLNPQWVEELKESYHGDPWAWDQFAKITKGEDLPGKLSIHCGILRKKGRIYISSNAQWRNKMVQILHDYSVRGHSSILGTYQGIKKYFFWPKMKEHVIQHVQQCDVCQMNKGEHVPNPGLLEPIPIPEGVWEVITMDFIGGCLEVRVKM
jgi:Integrase zinc binding domain/RNase H-like domain found in reverse transcriptase